MKAVSMVMRYSQMGFLAIVLSLFAYPVMAVDLEFEGQYKSLDRPLPLSNPKQHEIIEVFWYGCPHCFQFDPYLKEWEAKKPANVTFIRLPAVLNPPWELHARTYYTAEALGVLDKTHEALFNAIHVEGKSLNNESTLAEFFAKYGVSAKEFKETLYSFTVEMKIKQAKELIQRFDLHAVPAVIVDGRYLVDGELAGSHAQVIKVAQHLIQ